MLESSRPSRRAFSDRAEICRITTTAVRATAACTTGVACSGSWRCVHSSRPSVAAIAVYGTKLNNRPGRRGLTTPAVAEWR